MFYNLWDKTHRLVRGVYVLDTAWIAGPIICLKYLYIKCKFNQNYFYLFTIWIRVLAHIQKHIDTHTYTLIYICMYVYIYIYIYIYIIVKPIWHPIFNYLFRDYVPKFKLYTCNLCSTREYLWRCSEVYLWRRLQL